MTNKQDELQNSMIDSIIADIGSINDFQFIENIYGLVVSKAAEEHLKTLASQEYKRETGKPDKGEEF
ncbi:hypothetical protein [Enterococcus wangshanyuanii]|uniref:Transposase n=1 Tax=Enterococcus wangshanyuanii TaxID=2005703 RepID=A0ABQ1NEF3_9ENTE|nr:hypothetical protein [Enterococcus wangshanyuanii]GGC74554.1 hypothetical protein GCM10011573_00060 [Enterococcus wangshanyuanii]